MLTVLLVVSPVAGQIGGFFGRTQLSSAVRLDEVDSPTRADLERFRAFLADKQWDEAVETLERIKANAGDKLIRLTSSADYRDGLYPRWMNLRDYCQLQLASLAEAERPALALYRSRVDPLSERWFRQGVSQRDESLLNRVAGELFASSFGDDALAALGEIALEQGDYTAARGYWERISPRLRGACRQWPGVLPDGQTATVEGRPLWLAECADRASGVTPQPAPSAVPSWLVYPDTDLDIAAILARLVLVSILEGSPSRAHFELSALEKMFPDASGMLAGQTVKYGPFLGEMLAASANWPALAPSEDWSTFAASSTRNGIAASELDVGGLPLWKTQLGQTFADRSNLGERVADDFNRLLYCHPVVADDLLMIADEYSTTDDPDRQQERIRALQLSTGEPAWAGGNEPGVIFAHQFVARRESRPTLGVPRFTLTVSGHKLLARMGTAVTNPASDDVFPREQSYLVGLDLSAQGRMLWEPIRPDGTKWAFEGSPVTDGTNLYIAMRSSEDRDRPQAHVAAYDLETGRLRWRRWVCAAETPARTNADELTHNLLTLDHGTLYFNTNLGAVAALRAHDGSLRWVTVYPRATSMPGEAQHWGRDLNPCLFYRGLVIAAPADCERVFALDATTGQMVWESWPTDAIHLLGVGQETLLASGSRLWWLDVYTGRTLAKFPSDQRPDPLGFGRGVLAGDAVYWPTRDEVYVFSQRAVNQLPRQVRQPWALGPLGLTGGNLITAGGYLVLTTGNEVCVFRPGH